MKHIFFENSFTINSVEQTTDGFMIEGYCCHFDSVNLNSQIVDAKSFNTFLGMYNEGKLTPKLNWNHTDMYIGSINTIKVDNTGLYIECTLNTEAPRVRDELIPNIKAGLLTQFSTEGYIMNGLNGIVEHSDGSYYIKDFILTDVAIVAHPADTDATFTIKNYIEELKAEVKEDEKEAVKDSSLVLL